MYFFPQDLKLFCLMITAVKVIVSCQTTSTLIRTCVKKLPPTHGTNQLPVVLSHQISAIPVMPSLCRSPWTSRSSSLFLMLQRSVQRGEAAVSYLSHCHGRCHGAGQVGGRQGQPQPRASDISLRRTWAKARLGRQPIGEGQDQAQQGELGSDRALGQLGRVMGKGMGKGQLGMSACGSGTGFLSSWEIALLCIILSRGM